MLCDVGGTHSESKFESEEGFYKLCTKHFFEWLTRMRKLNMSIWYDQGVYV